MVPILPCKHHVVKLFKIFPIHIHLCPAADLVDNGGHELWVRLLVGEELSNDLVHDVLWREEVVQELRQNPGHHPSLAG